MDASKFNTIDWVIDAEKLNHKRLSRPQQSWRWNHVKHAALSWVTLAWSGVLIGAIAVVITLSTGWLADIREGYCSTSWYLNESICCIGETEACTSWKKYPGYIAYPLYILISVLFAAAASFIVAELAPLAAGSGISEIKCIVSGFDAPQFLDGLVLLIKCIALPLTIASGFSVGKEGPSVHFAACAGHIISSKVMELDYHKRSDIITACCAAGVAVAFGSPIGGLLFGIEEIASHLSMNTIWRSFFCCLVATTVVAVFNPFRNGQLVIFSVQYDSTWHMFELPFFALIGVFGGVVGQFIIKYNLRITALRKRYWGAKYFLHEAILISLITAAACYWNQYLKVDMTKSMQYLFHECEHGGEVHQSCDGSNKGGIMISLLVAGIIRLALLLISYGAGKVPAGIFVPSLAIGALFGRLVGTFVWSLFSNYPDSAFFGKSCDGDGLCINPGAYAVLGAGALLAGVMHITLTVVVVMFELTGAVHYIVPTMIVVGITRLISSQVGKSGIADMAIEMNKYPYLEEESPDFDGKKLNDVMIPAFRCSTLSNELYQLDEDRQYSTYPVVNSDREFLGAYNGSKMDKGPITFSPNEPLENVHTVFAKIGPHTVYAVENGKFVGMLTRKGMVEAHGTHIIEFTDLEKRFGEIVRRLFERIDVLTEKISNRIRRR